MNAQREIVTLVNTATRSYRLVLLGLSLWAGCVYARTEEKGHAKEEDKTGSTHDASSRYGYRDSSVPVPEP